MSQDHEQLAETMKTKLMHEKEEFQKRHEKEVHFHLLHKMFQINGLCEHWEREKQQLIEKVSAKLKLEFKEQKVTQ